MFLLKDVVNSNIEQSFSQLSQISRLKLSLYNGPLKPDLQFLFAKLLNFEKNWTKDFLNPDVHSSIAWRKRIVQQILEP